MRHCGTEREREREGEQRWTEGKDKEAAWYSIACVCPCEQMASIGEPSLLGQETGALTRCSDLLPVATSSRLSCLHVPPPMPALIHSNCQTACIMLSNRNNPPGDGASYGQ